MASRWQKSHTPTGPGGRKRVQHTPRRPCCTCDEADMNQDEPGVPSGEHMENHHFSWENPLFLWPFSIATLNYQRVHQTLPDWFSFSPNRVLLGKISGNLEGPVWWSPYRCSYHLPIGLNWGNPQPVEIWDMVSPRTSSFCRSSLMS